MHRLKSINPMLKSYSRRVNINPLLVSHIEVLFNLSSFKLWTSYTKINVYSVKAMAQKRRFPTIVLLTIVSKSSVRMRAIVKKVYFFDALLIYLFNPMNEATHQRDLTGNQNHIFVDG